MQKRFDNTWKSYKIETTPRFTGVIQACSPSPPPSDIPNAVELSPGSAGVSPAQGAGETPALPDNALKSTVLSGILSRMPEGGV
jgi:hypothetical protein